MVKTVAAMKAHCIIDIENEGMELLNLHIAPYYLYTKFQNALSSNYIKILTANFPLKSNKVNDFLSDAGIQQIKALFLSIRREFEEKQSDYITLVNNYISAIFILFSRAYSHTGFSKKEKQSHQKLLKAIEYIDAHYKEEIKLDEIADEISYSRCYFSTLFKKNMGMSLWDYICIKRIEEALTQIKTTEKSILDIALDCGFNNTVNFNKIFKKYTNVAPSTFRR